MYKGESWEWLLPQTDSVTIENDTVRIGFDKAEYYNPFELINLPNALAKVEDKKGAIEFVQNYGLLGYSSLLPESDRGPYAGDPLNWFLDQAKTVKFVMHLIGLLRWAGKEYIINFIENHSVKVPAYDDGNPDVVSAYLFAEGSETVLSSYSRWDLSDFKEKWNERDSAFIMISSLVNANTKGVRRILTYNGMDNSIRFKRQYSAKALIEVIWHLVGNAALASENIKTCANKECGLPFIATDKRQRFCPPSTVAPGKRKQSLCGAKTRMKKYRNPQDDEKGGAN